MTTLFASFTSAVSPTRIERQCRRKRSDHREEQRNCDQYQQGRQKRRRVLDGRIGALTPKIRTGMVSGSTRIDTSSPPRGSDTATAAPAAPMRVMAGVPASSVSMRRTDRKLVHVHEQPEQRRGDHQRQAGRRPVRQAFHQHGQHQRCLLHQHQKVERAILPLRLKQPVEPKQRGKQRADPEDRRRRSATED